MYCPKCGVEINDDDVFCSRCGNKFKTQKSIKLTKKHIIILSVITFVIAGIIFNECRVYFSIKEYKEAVSLVIQANLNDIDILEDKMTDKCTDDGVRGKYGYSAQNIYFKQKACYKNAEKIADEKRKIYYQKLNEYKQLNYWGLRKKVKIEKGKLRARKQIIKHFNNNEGLAKSFITSINKTGNGLSDNKWDYVAHIERASDTPLKQLKLIYAVGDTAWLRYGDYYMNETGEVEYKPELSKQKNEFNPQ